MFYVFLLGALCFFESVIAGRSERSAAIQSLSEETSNILGDLVNAINPVFLVIVGVLIVAGCAFELSYGSRGTTQHTAHVASRNAPYATKPGAGVV